MWRGDEDTTGRPKTYVAWGRGHDRQVEDLCGVGTRTRQAGRRPMWRGDEDTTGRSSTCHARNIVPRLASPTLAAPPLATPATSCRTLHHQHRLRHLLPRLHHRGAPCAIGTGCATSCHACKALPQPYRLAAPGAIDTGCATSCHSCIIVTHQKHHHRAMLEPNWSLRLIFPDGINVQ